MIDITTIQTYPVAPSLSNLQLTNAAVTKNNEQLKTALKSILVAGCIYITYRVIKKYYDDIDTTENQW